MQQEKKLLNQTAYSPGNVCLSRLLIPIYHLKLHGTKHKHLSEFRLEDLNCKFLLC